MTTSSKKRPMRIMVYGDPGIGKSTLGASMPGALMVDMNGRTDHLFVDRHEQDTWSWADFEKLLKSGPKCGSLVFDDVVGMAELAEDEVAKDYQKPFAKIGWRDGHKAAATLWLTLLARIERWQRASGAHVCMICHARVAKQKNPAGEDYGQIVPDLEPEVRAPIVRWCDAVFYAHREILVGSDGKAVETGRHVLDTCGSAGWLAKNQWSLPARIDMSWPDLIIGIEESESLRKRAHEAMSKMKPADRARAMLMLAKEPEKMREWLQKGSK